MNKHALEMLENISDNVNFLNLMADNYISVIADKLKRAEEGLAKAEAAGNFEQSLVLMGWVDALKEHVEYTHHMKREVMNAKHAVDKWLPVKPKLTLVVDNKKAPAATDAQHFEK